MNNFNYQTRLKAIWNEAVAQYKSGNRDANSYFDAEMLAELASIGLNPMDVYDPVEDHLGGAEIDFETFLLISSVRRDYFFTVQNQKPSDKRLDPSTLPAKDQQLSGIVWLPRIIHKAASKLRGELPAETMYGCGGDRRFFKTNDIHPSEFLRMIWAYEEDEAKIIDWVQRRKTIPDLEAV